MATPDINQIRDMLPGVQDTVWLNTGTCGPLPIVTADAMIAETRLDLTKARIHADHFPHIQRSRNEVRKVVAAAIHADPNEIAVTDSTTDGMYAAIMGYRWQPGDELIITNLEHPGGLIPSFVAKRRAGVHVRVVDLGLGGGEPSAIVRAFERSITPRTRMIAISHVSYTTGAKLPLREIVEMAQSHNILVAVDGAQSYGALSLDMQELGVDFYACPGQKWMCGPDGTGALYVRASSIGEIEQTFVSGGYNREIPLDYYGASFAPSPGASRFDTGGRNTTLMLGQIAATDWMLHDVGLDWITERIATMAAYTHDELRRLPGVSVVTPREALAGLISFTVEGIDPLDLTARLALEHNVTVRNVIRYINNPAATRASVSFFNTEEDIDRLVEGVQAIQKTL